MISVLVVDDSVVIRRLVTDVLSSDPKVRVVGTAPDGRIALAKIAQLKPDVVTLDVEMPVLNGVETVRELRKTHPTLPVIMFSTLTSDGAEATVAALAAGATDYVTKPANAGSLNKAVTEVRDQLLPRIHALCGKPVYAPPPPRPPDSVKKVPAGPRKPAQAVLIGSSTGGPEALRTVLTKLPASLPVPILVAQHMPPVFTTMLARRIDQESALRVVEASDGEPLRPGCVYIAPGGRHMEVVKAAGGSRVRLHDGPMENHCRPAVDVLFRSATRVYGSGSLVVMLTGMGQDGKLGTQGLAALGAEVIAQDQATSVVWGMPGAVVSAGLADAVLPLGKIAENIVARVSSQAAAIGREVARWK
ncbi:chemotaxis response regulator protein-glutamate methylesterase [Actinokineospora auranticolor]|uniref:Protein-glutamate methylesterase/protein-glutamine glutaminase n=1 Tax=Actinokineospora auranticolor TaxID=155976 RepID=A0A2S6GMR8_9PSEU|nr:chemotaxis response regulator protein-glutamate methylesterase [Actinokineospora auranticolor]PPK66507.1 two-component system chemotaxis response regulator CheB [Actinokineospora auranticolor]